jgi:U3 small nucleolar RNA-associated protein 11
VQKAEKLKESLHFIGLAPQNKHTVFVDSSAEAAAFKASQFFDTPAELLGRTYNRPRNAQLQQQQAAPSTATAERVERCAVRAEHAGSSSSRSFWC